MNLDFNWGKYFTEEEFKCSHTGKCDMDQDFIDRINQLREQYGKPIKITSGYRDATHPIEARKKEPGAHASGYACDIGVRGGDALQTYHLELLMNVEHAKQVVDGISMATVVGALVDLLPAIAAIFTIVWTGIRIYETKTVQKWLGKDKKRIIVEDE